MYVTDKFALDKLVTCMLPHASFWITLFYWDRAQIIGEKDIITEMGENTLFTRKCTTEPSGTLERGTTTTMLWLCYLNLAS